MGSGWFFVALGVLTFALPLDLQAVRPRRRAGARRSALLDTGSL
jgi:hypothetical protein